MSQHGILDKKQSNKIIQEHLNFISEVFRQIAANNIKEMKSIFSDKKWHYEQKLHQQFIEKSINKTMEKIQCFLVDIVFGQEVSKYREEMASKKTEQTSRILRIKGLAQQISNSLKQQQIRRCQQEIKIKLHQFKPNQFNFIPRMRQQQDQSSQIRINNLLKKLKLYEQRYDKDPSKQMVKDKAQKQ